MNSSWKVLCGLVFAWALMACVPPGPVLVTPLQGEITPAKAEIEVFFTEPNSPGADSFRGGVDERLVEAIDAASVSIDMAAHDFNLWSLRDALIAAHKRGVTVRVVAESDNLDRAEFQQLLAAGIPIRADGGDGRMHNKFIVIDGYEVWTGSMNFTVNGVYRNNNNLVHIRSTRLAENYRQEFEEMFTAGIFGVQIGYETPNPLLSLNGVAVENYFSPEDHVADALVRLVQSARQSVVFAAFSFTSDPLADAMLERAAEGISISGVFEGEQYYSNQGTEFDRLQTAGLDVFLDDNPHSMHHKFLVVDGQVVATGSYNFSRSAEERNDENVLVIHDAGIAAQYLQEFERLAGSGE